MIGLDFQELAELRLREARALLAAGYGLGAYYLAGYAVECALKACIAGKTQAGEFPPNVRIVQAMYTHNLAGLVGAAGLTVDRESREKASSSFAVNWSIVKDWSEDSRYTVQEDTARAEAMINAVGGVDGVLEWLRQIW